MLKLLWQDESGQDLIEYALLVAFIGLALLASMNSLAGGVVNVFSNASANLTTTS
jgi:pilus assembly protein Flp/PilA